MFLENVRPNKRNTNVTVNQTIYLIGPGGFITTDEDKKVPYDVPEDDAAKLLQGKSWRTLSWDPKDPGNAAKFIDAVGGYPPTQGLGRPPRDMSGIREEFGLKPANRAELPPQAIGTGSKDGQLTGVEETPPSDEELQKAIERDQRREDKDASSDKRVSDAQMSSSEAVQMSGDADVGDGKTPAGAKVAPAPTLQGKEDTIVDPPVPTDGDWPDPTAAMSLGYLHEMADAYKVKYAKNAGKKTLIKRVMDEMYTDD